MEYVSAHNPFGGENNRDNGIRTKWHTAGDATLRELRSYLCTDGWVDWRRCKTCESECAYGRRMVHEVESGAVPDYASKEFKKERRARNHANGTRLSELLLCDRAEKELVRVFEAGGRRVDWAELLMESEAKAQEKRSGKPAWPETETNDAITSAFIRTQGLHNFSVMGGLET